MAEKDITTRDLVNKADVFADIVNGGIFILTGEWPSPLVRPEDLVDTSTRSVSVSGGDVRGLERDVAKLWTVGETVFCLMGLENQTTVDPNMPFRVFSYEGADYRRQLEELKANKDGGKKQLYPVLTLVLYFGTDRPWPKDQRSLLNRFPHIARPLRSLLNQYWVNLLELARLTPDQRGAFRSDFRILVDYLCQTWQNKDFVPSDQVIVHVEALVRCLSALTGDRGLIEKLPIIQQRGEPMTVRNFFGEARLEGMRIGKAEGIQIGEARGIQIGEAQGIQIGEARGEARGRVQGGLNMLVSLVGDGLLSPAAAARKAGMTEDEFKTLMRGQEGAGES